MMPNQIFAVTIGQGCWRVGAGVVEEKRTKKRLLNGVLSLQKVSFFFLRGLGITFESKKTPLLRSVSDWIGRWDGRGQERNVWGSGGGPWVTQKEGKDGGIFR